MSEGDKKSQQWKDLHPSTALIFWLIFIYNTVIDSYEHKDYTGLKSDGSGAK